MVPPYLALILNMSNDADIYLEYEGLARMNIFKFTGIYYVDVSNSTDVEDILAGKESPVLVVVGSDGRPIFHNIKRTE